MAEEQGHSEEEHFEEEHFVEEHFEEEYEVEENEEHFEEEHIEEEGKRVEYNTPPRAKKSKLAGASKYGSRYQQKWEQEFPFIKRGIQDSVYSFYCKVCQRDIRCRHQGIADLKRHDKTSSHAIRVRSMQGSSKLSEMGFVQIGSATDTQV